VPPDESLLVAESDPATREGTADAVELTRTERAALTAGTARTRWRRWWRRRPIRRSLVLIHRWPSLLLGIFLLLETTTGSVLLFQGEYFRATHSDLYAHTASAHPLTADQAVAAVTTAHPDFTAIWATKDDGTWVVGDAEYHDVYGVDPGTGHVSGTVNTDGGVMGVIANLHNCAFSCDYYPAHVAALEHPVPTLGQTWLTEITWAKLILGTLGVLIILLVVTGVITWWPGRKRISHGFRVRTGKGRFARDYDLHNLVGIIALPFLLMWGVTGAAFEFPVVEKGWLAITGGQQLPEQEYSITPRPHAKNAVPITSTQAIAAALRQVRGEAIFVGLPYEGADYYEIDIRTPHGPSAHRALYSGDTYVYVDQYDDTHTSTAGAGRGPLANRFYEKVFEPSHFGWNVNAWWRIIWFVFGMAPLVLGITSVSTWLHRRWVKKRRKRRRSDAPAPA
jgi:uncharacterized iron-regulated membrane protein